jgi:hypothetical protein
MHRVWHVIRPAFSSIAVSFNALIIERRFENLAVDNK